MRTIILLLLISLPAAAQVDWDSDNVGIFFDTEATQLGATVPFGTTVVAYFIGINLTDPAPIDSFDGGCFWLGGIVESRFWDENTYPFSFISEGIFIPEDCVPGVHFRGAFANPAVPDGDSVVLGTLEIPVLSSGPLGVFSHDPHTSLTMADGSERTLIPAVRPVSSMPPATYRLYATINNDWVPVANEPASFSELKSLYR